MPLLLEKSLVMHVGCNQPIHSYHSLGNQLKSVDCYTDLEIIALLIMVIEITLMFYQRRQADLR